MARDGAIYVCQTCGAVHAKWAGQCNACQGWNTLVEETQSRAPGTLKPAKTRGLNFEDLRSDNPEPPRLTTGVAEFDRVCGGGVIASIWWWWIPSRPCGPTPTRLGQGR